MTVFVGLLSLVAGAALAAWGLALLDRSAQAGIYARAAGALAAGAGIFSVAIALGFGFKYWDQGEFARSTSGMPMNLPNLARPSMFNYPRPLPDSANRPQPGAPMPFPPRNEGTAPGQPQTLSPFVRRPQPAPGTPPNANPPPADSH